MEHFYNKIHGYFDFSHVYDKYTTDIKDGATFVEIGAFCGKSLAYFIVEALNKNKDLKIFSVDSWKGMEYDDRESGHLNDYVKKLDCTLFEHFMNNLEPVKDSFTPIQAWSHEAASEFEDKSIDYIFLDADHTYEGVKKDLEAWYPKLKTGGIFSGHDYYPHPPDDGVFRAVNEFFETHKVNTYRNNVWEITK